MFALFQNKFIPTSGQQYTWPSVSGNDIWIASDFLDETRRLIFRHCLDNKWTPNTTEFEGKCRIKNLETSQYPNKDCPNLYTEIELQV